MQNNCVIRDCVIASDDEQRPLPLDDMPPFNPTPITTHLVVDINDRHGRGYELVVHQDPFTRHVLAYRLHAVTT